MFDSASITKCTMKTRALFDRNVDQPRTVEIRTTLSCGLLHKRAGWISYLAYTEHRHAGGLLRDDIVISLKHPNTAWLTSEPRGVDSTPVLSGQWLRGAGNCRLTGLFSVCHSTRSIEQIRRNDVSCGGSHYQVTFSCEVCSYSD